MTSPPTNPARHIVWAIVWSVMAVISFVALFFEGARALGGDVSGQRSSGMILVPPFILLAAAALCFILAILGTDRWNHYVARTTAGERQYALDDIRSNEVYRSLLAIGFVIATIALAGIVFLVVGFAGISSTPGGLALYLMFAGLLSAGAFAVLEIGFRRRASHLRMARHLLTHPSNNQPGTQLGRAQ